MVSACCSVGCDSSKLVEVSGIVTFDGKPVPSGQIEFYPKQGRPASGGIQSDGRYVLTSLNPGDGIPPGDYVVTITARSVTGGPPIVSPDEADNSSAAKDYEPAVVEWLVPRVYSSRKTSRLTAEVPEGGGEINFDLVPKP